MKHEDLLQRHLELCKRMFSRMQTEDSWPWRDSTKPDDLVESEDNSDNV